MIKQIAFLFFASCVVISLPAISEDSQQIVDQTNHWKCTVPASWRIAQSTDTTSFFRFRAISPKKDIVLSGYALHIDGGNIDLNRFVSNDRKFFKDLGIEKSSKEIKNGLFSKAIEKTYYNNKSNIYCVGRYYIDGTYGYVVLGDIYSLDRIGEVLSIFNTIQVDVSLYDNLKNKFTDSSGSHPLVNIIKTMAVLVAVYAGIYLLGLLGMYLRRGINLKKTLSKIRRDARAEGKDINDKWHAFNKKGTIYLSCTAPLLIALLSGVVYFVFTNRSWVPLLTLGPSILGGFGILLGPSTDPTDLLD